MISNTFHEPILGILHGAVSNLKETMEDEDGNITGQSNSQSFPNNTLTRSVERTATQKLFIPIFEKNDHTSAKLR